MFKAILFDLDGTLLNIDMNIFIPNYLSAMKKKVCDYGFPDPDGFINLVWECTGKMIMDKSPLTNREVFMKNFFASGKYEPEKTLHFFAKFYEEDFQDLHIYSKPFPGIKETIAAAFQKDIPVVIATNAVFPAEAINMRLQWAGISDFSYALITSYENMHYCKPHLEYYAEIADQIGVSADDCLMVGNDEGEDLPASELGMKTYLLEELLIKNHQVNYRPDWRGKLSDLSQFIKNL